MSRKQRYQANEGRAALGAAVLGVGVVGLVGYVVYRTMRDSAARAQSYVPPTVDRIGPTPAGGRPPGYAPGSTSITSAQVPPK